MCQLTWVHVSRKSEALENISSSSKTSFLAYRWSKVTVEEETSTTILSNDEYQVYKTLPTTTASTWNKTVFHLLSTGSSNFSNNVMLGIGIYWHVGNGDVASPHNRKLRTLHGIIDVVLIQNILSQALARSRATVTIDPGAFTYWAPCSTKALLRERINTSYNWKIRKINGSESRSAEFNSREFFLKRISPPYFSTLKSDWKFNFKTPAIPGIQKTQKRGSPYDSKVL